MRVTHVVNPVVTDDAEGLDELFALNETKAKVVIDNYTKIASGRFSVVALGTEAINFGDVADVRAIYIKADNDFNFRQDGSLTPLRIRRPNALVGTTARMFAESQLTSATIENLSATLVLRGVWMVYGDLAP